MIKQFINLKKIKSSKGFTLIEMLVAILIFSLFLGIVIGAFLNFTRNYADANQKRKVYIEARQLVDRIAQEFRLKKIYYDCYLAESEGAVTALSGDTQRPCNEIAITKGITDTLALISPDGTERVFYRFFTDASGSFVQIRKQLSPLADSNFLDDTNGGYSGWIPIVSERFEVERLKFRIWPLDDPYVVGEVDEYQYQPKVSIFLTLAGQSRSGPDQLDRIDLQTTVSSRFYGI